MSGLGLTIEVDDLEAIRAQAEKLYGAVSGEDVRKLMGFAIKEVVQRHFIELAQDSAHHQTAQSLGADRTGFYEKARQGTHDPQLEGDGVSVSIDARGLAQRLFGGTIQARPGSYLTIPALAIAYGKRAREFDLRLVIFGDTGLAGLVAKRGTGDEGDVYYWLVRSVTQAADPTVLPEESEMLDEVKQNALAYIDDVWRITREGRFSIAHHTERASGRAQPLLAESAVRIATRGLHRHCGAYRKGRENRTGNQRSRAKIPQSQSRQRALAQSFLQER